MVNFDRINNLIEDLEKRNESYERKNFNEELLVGVDLGTAYIVIVVLDKDKNPVACEMEFAQVIKDGLVVDYAGARTIVKD